MHSGMFCCDNFIPNMPLSENIILFMMFCHKFRLPKWNLLNELEDFILQGRARRINHFKLYISNPYWLTGNVFTLCLCVNMAKCVPVDTFCSRNSFYVCLSIDRLFESYYFWIVCKIQTDIIIGGKWWPIVVLLDYMITISGSQK